MAKIDWKDADGTVSSIVRYHSKGGDYYSVVFTYVVDGHWCGGTFTTGEEYRVGDIIPVRYDPKNPDYNDREQKEKRTKWIIGIVVAIAVLWWLWDSLH